MKKVWSGIILSLSFLVGSQTHAAIDCRGLVDYVLLYADGTVNVRGAWRGDFTVLCNTSTNWGDIAPEICLSWYATATKAAADGKQLTVYYETNSSTCGDLPTYGASLVPFYVGIVAQ